MITRRSLFGLTAGAAATAVAPAKAEPLVAQADRLAKDYFKELEACYMPTATQWIDLLRLQEPAGGLTVINRCHALESTAARALPTSSPAALHQ